MYFLSFQAKHFRHPINRAVMDHDNSNNDGGFVRSNCAPGFSCARYSAIPQNPLYVMAPICQGTNSFWPYPWISLFDAWPDAVARIS